MPSFKTNFSLNYEDVERIQQAILRCGSTSEDVINDYLHNKAGDIIIQSITKFIPRSKVNKVHAKDSKWHEQTNYNLAVNIANSTKGKRDKSFYYLYYVATGTGTSRKNGPNDFMSKGLDKEYDNIVNGVIDELLKNINKEMK